jgi:mannose-6-phosphate isomerase-like protein (cupin superfamily)
MDRKKHSTAKIEIALLDNLKSELNAHLQGLKRVFIRNDDNNDTTLTQFAYGYMSKGDQSGMHVHATMDEYFFIISGEGILLSGEESFSLMPSSFVRIPAGNNHNLMNGNNQTLEFVYFGIAV